jgi:hypothetical protein
MGTMSTIEQGSVRSSVEKGARWRGVHLVRCIISVALEGIDMLVQVLRNGYKLDLVIESGAIAKALK